MNVPPLGTSDTGVHPEGEHDTAVVEGSTACREGSAAVDRSSPTRPATGRRIPESEALDWANAHLAPRTVERVARRPWSTVWRIGHADGTAWLKRVAPAIATGVSLAPRLAALAPGAVPAVLAHDASRGLLLLADHGGRDLARTVDETVRTRLLVRYATLQGRTLGEVVIGEVAPARDAVAALDELLAFLGPDGGATRFLSRRRASLYRRLLEHRAPLLRRRLERARSLPALLEHGDLRTANAARRDRSDIVLYDWEEAVSAPAGFSLHGLFGGSDPVLAVLARDHLSSDPEALAQTRRELDAYIDALAATGYADTAVIRHGLGAAAVAGVMSYLASFARFDDASGNGGGERYRRRVRGNLKRRFSDLLDVCERWSVEEGNVVPYAARLLECDRAERAASLLAAAVRHHPDDAGVQRAHAERLLAEGRARDALAAFEACRALGADTPALARGRADCHARLGQLDAAIAERRRAFRGDGDAQSKPSLARLQELARLERDADAPGRVPTITFDPHELADGHASAETSALAERLFRRHGVLILRGAFDPELLERCRETFLERYRRYLADERPDDALRIGDRRLQVTIDLAPPYDSPALYANELLMPLMRRLLGKRCTLGCFTSAMSLPGAAEQRLHKDHKALFEGDPDAGTVPSFAVTTMVPLVPVDERVGTTRVKKGSHRLTSAESLALPLQTPLTEPGDCYLMDYRLSHHGQANRSDAPRPILSLVYQRPWFRDFINFAGQPPLGLDRTTFESLPDAHKPLLAWAMEPGPRERGR